MRHHHQGTYAANKERDNLLKFLALKEFLEILVPAVYCVVFTGSYFGPNSHILGGIGADRWHLKRTKNLYEKFEHILIFTLAESFRGVVFALILFKFYKLNMYSAYCYIVRNYGSFIMLTGGLCNIIVNCCYVNKYELIIRTNVT